jgi:hypothetical protein
VQQKLKEAGEVKPFACRGQRGDQGLAPAKGGQKLKHEDLHNPENYLPDAMRSKHRKKRRRINATDANAAEIAARQLRAL